MMNSLTGIALSTFYDLFFILFALNAPLPASQAIHRKASNLEITNKLTVNDRRI